MLKIETATSKSGKRTMYFATVNGKRLSRTNYARKWEAERLLTDVIAHYGKERLMEMMS